MPITFDNAPLVELIAEFKWTPNETLNRQGQPGSEPEPQVIPFLGGAKLEEFLMRVGGELYQSGFQMSERLVPPGFPALPNQAIVRFRRNDAPESSVIYQAGPGLLTVNATPPYRTWKEFLPHVENGLRVLIKCRNDSEKSQPFGELTLRYIDLFDANLTQGRSVNRFLSDVIGISLKLPDAVRNLSPQGEITSLNILFVLPIPQGTLTMNVADGKVGSRPGTVMITSVTSKEAWKPDADAIMGWLSVAHDVIHSIFMNITTPIHRLMKPKDLDK
ncbi:MAG TPA: TIGR04255 family protein [Candidatus Limnocylindrales bacterium]|nr:TIGR04255 family protein [Candidatus Limnocylindrales bacterium]